MRYISPILRSEWGPEFNHYRAGWADRLEAIEKILRRSLELQKTIVRGFQDAGVPLMVGTDAPLTFVYPGFAVHQELALFVDSGLSPYEALRSATVTPAKELELEDVGTVAVGRRADLVLVEGNPLVEIANASRVAGVVTGSRWLTKEELDLRLEELARSYEPLAERIDVLMSAYRTGDAEEIARDYRSMEEPSEELTRFAEDRLFTGLGYRHLGDGEVQRAIEVFRLGTETFPEISNTWDSLGEALMSAEDWEGALSSYRKALELDPENATGQRKMEWLEATLAARNPSITLSAPQLEPLAGDYGPRHVRLRGDHLYYQRDGGDEFRLIPMTETLLALENYPNFRLRFELG